MFFKIFSISYLFFLLKFSALIFIIFFYFFGLNLLFFSSFEIEMAFMRSWDSGYAGSPELQLMPPVPASLLKDGGMSLSVHCLCLIMSICKCSRAKCHCKFLCVLSFYVFSLSQRFDHSNPECLQDPSLPWTDF